MNPKPLTPEELEDMNINWSVEDEDWEYELYEQYDESWDGVAEERESYGW